MELTPPNAADDLDGRATARMITRTDIEAARGAKLPVDAYQPLGVIREFEPAGGKSRPHAGLVVDVLTIFLAGAECSFRCTMCDLWRQTLPGPTPAGALPRQLQLALSDAGQAFASDHHAAGNAAQPPLPHVLTEERWIKLYNASNFFDPRCVPRQDWADIAVAVQPFSRVVVENHPRLIDESVAKFASQLDAQLEIAIGLETADDASLRLLHKQMTLSDFARAAEQLSRWNIDLRVFILLQPPGTPVEQATHWVMQSLQFAEHHGARHCSVIPTRGGNGVMESLAAAGLFSPPTAHCLEQTLAAALTNFPSMVVTADLWDWDRLLGRCSRCSEPRRQRLLQMNWLQDVLPMIDSDCECLAAKG